MAGGDGLAHAADRVVDDAEAGGVKAVPEAADDFVEVEEELVQRLLEIGERTARGAQSAHGDGLGHAVPHDVSNDESNLLGRQRDDVIPVAASTRAVTGGLVTGAGGHSGQCGRRRGSKPRWSSWARRCSASYNRARSKAWATMPLMAVNRVRSSWLKTCGCS